MGVKKCFMVGGGGLRGELDEAGVDVVEVEGVVDGEEGFKALKLDPQVCKQTPPPPPNLNNREYKRSWGAIGKLEPRGVH
jgi:hypothetical protein